jgi:hypothetical protein
MLGTVRATQIGWRRFLIADFVSVMPTVLAHDNVGVFNPFAEEEPAPGAWQMLPVVGLGHPEADGKQITMKDAGAEEFILGFITNDVSIGPGKRKGLMWFDSEVTKWRAPELHEKLINALAGMPEPIPLSVGFAMHTEKESGTDPKTGLEYAEVAITAKPDHLAVMLGKTPAVSVEQGCGLLLT